VMMTKVVFAFAVAVLVMAVATEAYKPIVFLHGFTGSYLEVKQMTEDLERYQPGHQVFALNVDNKWASLKKLQTLVDDATEVLKQTIAENEEAFKDGFIFLGHSQGGIISRAMIEQNAWNITKYISVAGVQDGFFGDCGIWFSKNLTCDVVSDVMYTKAMQNSFSVAGYWRTPDREMYLTKNLFLPILNNEEDCASTEEYQQMQKENFLRVKEYHFFASPDDEVIKPWFTSLFQTLGTDTVTRVPLEDQYIYQKDTFGLRTAVEQGRVHFYEVPGVKHVEWIESRSDIYTKYLFPLFD